MTNFQTDQQTKTDQNSHLIRWTEADIRTSTGPEEVPVSRSFDYLLFKALTVINCCVM